MSHLMSPLPEPRAGLRARGGTRRAGASAPGLLAARAVLACLCLFLCLGLAGAAQAASPAQHAAPAQSPTWPELRAGLRADHPRLFLNRDMLPAIRDRANGPARRYYQRMVKWAERQCRQRAKQGDQGREAAALALLHLLTGKPRYLQAARERLAASAAYYRSRDQRAKAVDWYATTRVNALCAYDWLYNDLTPQERLGLGRELLAHVVAVQPTPGGRKVMGRNTSDPTSGFYGTPSLLWYAGLALAGSGVDDAQAEDFLARGYADHIELLGHRARIAAHSGAITYTLGYALGAYPCAEFNFFHTMRAALGRDIAPDWPHPANLPEYILWNRLPGNLWFGSGDAYHQHNRLPDWQTYTHLSQIRHFYGRTRKDQAALAAWLQGHLAKREHSIAWPAIPLLLTAEGQSPPPRGPQDLDLPPARRYPNLGQVFMRSGWGDGAACALFIGGGISDRHKHFDENSFVIFHRGFLALDTGSRPEMVSPQVSAHTVNYFPRTIAHNAMLIHEPGEAMPTYWGMRVDPTPNDGGQNRPVGSRTVAFETHPEYSYVAGDATGVYSRAKCGLALRQFVFIPPRYFVVFDRVEARRADYKKTWLLHTAREPQILDKPAGNRFRAGQGRGALFCTTLLPQRAVLTKVGGPGRQFMNGGRNWPLPDGYKIANDNELLGQWRVEVSPERPAREDLFLHLIEVGGADQAKPRAQAIPIETADAAGLELTDGDLKVRLTFATKGLAGGWIEYEKGGTEFKRALSNRIEDQPGLH